MNKEDSSIIDTLKKRLDRERRIRHEAERIAEETTLRLHNINKELSQSRDYLHSIVTSMLDMLIVLSPNCNIQNVNNAVCTLLGYTESELLGQPFERIIARRQVGNTPARDEVYNGTTFAEELLLKGSIIDHRVSYRTKSGERIPVSLYGSAIRTDSGQIGSIICVARDMREVIRLVQIEKEKNNAVSEAIGVLAKGMSHEINNALTGALGLAELIEQGHGKEGDLKIVISESLRAVNIVKDLLTYTNAEIGRMVAVSVSGFLSKALDAVGSNLAEHNIIVDVIYPPGGYPFVNGNPMQLCTALVKVITNAIDAMPGGGSIKINTAIDNTFVQIDIADSGPGIPLPVITKIFDPFFTTKNKTQGTGMGLSVAIGIIRAHGGTIEAANRAEGGALFKIRLPVKIDAPAAPAPATLETPNLAGLSILVVDDEPMILKLFKRLLTEHVSRLVTASDVNEALELLNKETFHVVISDHLMPGKTGLDFLSILKERARPEAKHFIMITGLAEPNFGDDIPILHKPLDIDDVLGTIKQVAEGRWRPVS